MSDLPCPLPGGRLLIEGGGDDMPPSALETFCEWSAQCLANKAKTRVAPAGTEYIALIPWPTSYTEAEVLEHYASEHWFGHQKQFVLKLAPSAAAIEAHASAVALDYETDPANSWAGLKSLVEGSCGVWICGGDQNNISDLFEKMPGMKSWMQALYSAGLPFGGTSAGASIMSETMFTGEGGNGDVDDEEQVLWNFITPNRVGIRSGLGLVGHMVIDQHFNVRQRSNRLLSVMSEASRIEQWGIGVDEDCAVCITDNHLLEVLGAPEKVCVLLQRVGTSRDTYVTRLLHASPDRGVKMVDLLKFPAYDEDEC